MLLLLCNLTNFLLQKSFLNQKFLSRNPVSQSGAPQDVNNKCDKKKSIAKAKISHFQFCTTVSTFTRENC